MSCTPTFKTTIMQGFLNLLFLDVAKVVNLDIHSAIKTLTKEFCMVLYVFHCLSYTL